jgi:hypothetical protein
MTPPLSNLKDTFYSPVPPQDLPNLSPEEAESLNKTLFSSTVLDDDDEEHLTPVHSNSIDIVIGEDKSIGQGVTNMTLCHRVSISPLYPEESNHGFYDDEAELQKSCEAIQLRRQEVPSMPPPPPVLLPDTTTSPSNTLDKTPTHIHSSSQTPMTLIKHLTTPATESTVQQSFWSDMSPYEKRASSGKTGSSPVPKKRREEEDETAAVG